MGQRPWRQPDHRGAKIKTSGLAERYDRNDDASVPTVVQRGQVSYSVRQSKLVVTFCQPPLMLSEDTGEGKINAQGR